jgi:hypothetical protein
MGPYPTFPLELGGVPRPATVLSVVLDVADAGFLHRRGGQRLSAFGNALAQRPKQPIDPVLAPALDLPLCGDGPIHERVDDRRVIDVRAATAFRDCRAFNNRLICH